MNTNRQSDETKPIDNFGTAPGFQPALKQTSYSGTLLKDRYLIEGELGRGGIGVVYLARDTQLLQRPVVIKVLLESSENSLHTPWFRKKFDQEVEALVRIDHPGVVGVLDAGVMPDGKPFFVMQFVEGTTLRTLMNESTKQAGKLPLARVGALVRQIAAALSAAHDKGVIHRDLKPENVMVVNAGTPEEMARLIDFGIATVRDSQTATNNDTEKTKVAGALPYMAPEQLRGQPEAASDTWSLAVMTYEMLTGQMPFYADTLVTLHDLQRQGVIVPASKLRPDLPAAANQVLLTALSFESQKRPARARDFGEAFAQSLQATTQRETVLTPTPTEARTADGPFANDPGATAINAAPLGASPLAATAMDAAALANAPTGPTSLGQATNVIAAETAVASSAQATVPNRHAVPPLAAAPASVGAGAGASGSGLAGSGATGALDTRRPAPGRSPLPYFFAFALLTALTVGGISFYKMRYGKPSHLPDEQLQPAGGERPTAATPKQVLTYSLTARLKKANGKMAEYAEPAVFSAGDELRFNFKLLETGSFYVINEGPNTINGLPIYNVLYPAPGMNDAVIDKDKTLWLPSENPPWNVVDAEEGTERIWLVWSSYQAPELEAVRRAISAKNDITLKDAPVIKALQSFLEQNRDAARPRAEKEETLTRLSTRGDGKVGLLVYALKLEHH